MPSISLSHVLIVHWLFGRQMLVSELTFEKGIGLTYAAYPSATVPLGNLEDGYPYGLFLLARAGREDVIFRFMSAFEATFPKIKGPRLE
jgi:hypothetical protein